MARLPVPLTAADQAAGFWWDLSMRQVEVSRTLVFAAPRHARAFFEALIADNIDIGRPERAEIVFKRSPRGAKARGTFKTAIDRHAAQVTLNIFYKNSRIKQYLKDGRALRVETVINDANDFGCGLLLATSASSRPGAVTATACCCMLNAPARAASSRIQSSSGSRSPSVTADGRRAPAMRFGDPRTQALAGALCSSLGAAAGITSRSLRALMTGLLGRPYSAPQASYDLARLRRNGLISRRPHANTYDLTPDGLAFAVFYTKVHDRVPRPALRLRTAPGTAPAPQCPACHPAPHRRAAQHRETASRSLKTQLNCRSQRPKDR